MKKKQINHYKYYSKFDSSIELNIEKRYKILTVIIIVLLSILLLKIFYLQVIKNEHYSNKLDDLTKKVIKGDSTPRGRIYDRNGIVIVDNIGVKTICYKKNKNNSVTDEINLSYKLANMIDVDYSDLSDDSLRVFWLENHKKESNKKIKASEYKLLDERKMTISEIYSLKKKRITEKELNEYKEIDREAAYIYYLMNKGYSYAEKVIKNEGVTDLEYAEVSENIGLLNGVYTKIDWQRYYPYGNVLKSILGTVSNNGIPMEYKDIYLKEGYDLTDRVGTSYIEYQYEKYLKGTKATYKKNLDGSLELLSKGKRGNDIVLTIDINLQKAVEDILVEELLTAKNEANTEYFNSSFVVIQEPKTGEVLALAGKQLKQNSDSSYSVYDYTTGVINTSITPGSIVKGASHIVGYNTGALTIGERRNDRCIKIAATPIKCSLHEYGNIDDLQALKYSSNTYQFLTAIKVGKANYVYDGPLKIDVKAFDIYRKTFSEFGLGSLSEIDLPNEALGYKGKSTLSGLLLDFSIGQYDNYTPIEISQYISTIANSGTKIKPHLLKAVYSPTLKPLTEKIYEEKTTVMGTVNTKKEYMDRIKEGFIQVLKPGGTGYSYIDPINNPAGKTGTSESFIDTNKDGVIDTATTTTNFVGYAPYDDPKVSFTVISPDVALGDTNYNATSKVNRRISQKVSQKYFEIY